MQIALAATVALGLFLGWLIAGSVQSVRDTSMEWRDWSQRVEQRLDALEAKTTP